MRVLVIALFVITGVVVASSASFAGKTCQTQCHTFAGTKTCNTYCW